MGKSNKVYKFLKEFFRPNKLKIIILFILILITLFVTFLNRLSCFGSSCIPSGNTYYIYKFLLIINNQLVERIFPDTILFILQIVHLYILSCIMSFVINIFKQNVKNK